MIIPYLQPVSEIELSFLPLVKGERTWKVAKTIKVELSDGYILTIPKGFETDLRSSPSWLWNKVKPYNKALFAYLIHDRLYADKIGQMQHFAKETGKARPYESKKFADEEMLKWSTALAPEKKLENYGSYLAVRWFGNPIYWGRKSVPL